MSSGMLYAGALRANLAERAELWRWFGTRTKQDRRSRFPILSSYSGSVNLAVARVAPVVARCAVLYVQGRGCPDGGKRGGKRKTVGLVLMASVMLFETGQRQPESPSGPRAGLSMSPEQVVV